MCLADSITERVADADPAVSSHRWPRAQITAGGVPAAKTQITLSNHQKTKTLQFRNAIIPNEEYLFFSLFEYQFFPPNFEDGWYEALEYIRYNEHTLFFFLADGQYQWKSVMVFRDLEQHSKWIHEFYKEHGDLILDLKNTVVTNVLKFNTDPEVFRSLLSE